MTLKKSDLPDLANLIEWHKQCSNSLSYYKDYIQTLIEKNPIQVPVLFKGMSTNEFEDYFGELQGEISLLFIFYLISLTEGKIRVDFFERVEKELKDLVSKKYTGHYKKKGASNAKEIRLESILEIWKNYFSGNNGRINTIGEFKNRMKTRHWIAHGRYWSYSAYASYTVPNTFDKCDALLKLLPYTF
jgi:hypothetical protein